MNGFIYALVIFVLMLALSVDNNKPPAAPIKPIANTEKLAAIANYCLRYQKQPYINNCINDRSERNFIEAGK